MEHRGAWLKPRALCPVLYPPPYTGGIWRMAHGAGRSGELYRDQFTNKKGEIQDRENCLLH